MEPTKLLRALLPDVLIDNFDVVNFEKTDLRFDIWLDEKKVQLREDKKNSPVISHGFGASCSFCSAVKICMQVQRKSVCAGNIFLRQNKETYEPSNEKV